MIEIEINMNKKVDTDSDDMISYTTEVENKRIHDRSNANLWYTSHETGHFQDLYGPYFDTNHLRKGFYFSFFIYTSSLKFRNSGISGKFGIFQNMLSPKNREF